MIKYKYANGINGESIDIETLTDDTRRSFAPYKCFGCNEELIPVLPTQRRKHFSHKVNGNCSKETYLHELAKNKFYQEYKYCLDNNESFIFEFVREEYCAHYKEIVGNACFSHNKVEFDLTTVFTDVFLEKSIHGFRPDILLSSSSDNPQNIFIEINVTHSCEENKIETGIRIIEIKIGCEEDILPIESHLISDFDDKIETYNLKIKSINIDRCNGNCHEEVYVFVVFRDGTVDLIKSNPRDALTKYNKTNTIYSEIVREEWLSKPVMFKDKIREVNNRKCTLRNCYVCRFHADKEKFDEIFCRIKRKECSSNEALNCNRFSPLPDI